MRILLTFFIVVPSLVSPCLSFTFLPAAVKGKAASTADLTKFMRCDRRASPISSPSPSLSTRPRSRQRAITLTLHGAGITFGEAAIGGGGGQGWGAERLKGNGKDVRGDTRKRYLGVMRAAEDGEASAQVGDANDSSTDTTSTTSARGGVVTAAAEEGKLPFYLDPNTRGGAVVVPALSLLLPLVVYGGLTAVGIDSNKAGVWVGVGYTLVGLIAWVGSYFFRVATKNMTYAVQLKNYEQAVIEKRFSELEEDEKDALLDEVNDS